MQFFLVCAVTIYGFVEQVKRNYYILFIVSQNEISIMLESEKSCISAIHSLHQLCLITLHMIKLHDGNAGAEEAFALGKTINSRN